jgi:hypothetical protein
MTKRSGTRPSSLNPRILRAAASVSAALTEKGYAHALIGGLAVNKYGYPRATDDVDFLVTGQAEHALTGDSLGGEVRGKTIIRKGVTIDLLFPNEHEKFLERAIYKASGAIPIIPKEALVYMKLTAGRMKDSADIVELLKRGKLNVVGVTAYLKKYRPDLVEDFVSLAEMARLEVD